MKILFDQNVPKKLKTSLTGHLIRTAWQEGWSAYTNGDLIRVAQSSGFEVLITADQNLVYQQNNASRRISIIVLGTTDWAILLRFTEDIGAALKRCAAGSYEHLPMRISGVNAL